MTEVTVFHRTKRQLFLAIFSAAMLSAASYLNFLDWQVGGRGFALFVGIAFGIWAVLMWLQIVWRRDFGHVGPEGIYLRRPLREFHLPWASLVWATADVDVRVNLIGYRFPGETKIRTTAFVAKSIGADGMAALLSGIKTNRPDLPTQPPDNP